MWIGCWVACTGPVEPPPSDVPVPDPGGDPEDFVVVDDRISDPSDNFSDPEFHAGSMQYTFSLRGDLFIGDIDPVTGALIPDHGRGEYIDGGLVPLTWGNGPEWMDTAGGTELVYSRLVGSQAEIVRAWIDGSGQWRTQAWPQGQGRLHPFGSLDPDDPEPRILYVDPTIRRMHWRYVDGPEEFLTDAFLEFAGRWIGGSHEVIYAAPTDDGRQVFVHDVDTDEITQLTDPPGSYGDTFMWTDPTLGERVFFATTDDDLGRPLGLAAFREVDGEWRIVQTIVPPLEMPYVVSPEPFVFAGNSYIIYAVSEDPINVDNGPAQIWLSGLFGAEDVHRRVSDADPVTRLDPEVLVTDETAWIYYTRIDPGTGAWVVHRCASGLAP